MRLSSSNFSGVHTIAETHFWTFSYIDDVCRVVRERLAAHLSLVSLLPADSRSAVGKPSASADGDPESACGPETTRHWVKQTASEGGRERDTEQREECNPSVPLSVLLLAAVREHAGANIPLVAHYSLLGQWEGAFYWSGVGVGAGRGGVSCFFGATGNRGLGVF